MSRPFKSQFTSISCLLLVLAVFLSSQNIWDRLALRLHSTHEYLQRHLLQAPRGEASRSESDDAIYQVQLFSQDPVILYINDFLTSFEIEHLLHLSQENYEVSKVFPGQKQLVDTESRVSDLAFFQRDPIYDRIARRAMSIQGWRGPTAFLQPPYVQRYEVGGFYKEHYDWDPEYTQGNRITTFLVYLSDNCTGGGTNFPRLVRPKDRRWCDIIECPSLNGSDSAVEGVTFKPRSGAAVFWENMHVNGSFNEDVLHSSLPVTSGVKYGLNMFTWDLGWRAPTT